MNPTLDAAERWDTLTDLQLLEQAWTLAEELDDHDSAACIRALAWRLKGSLEWIESRTRVPARR